MTCLHPEACFAPGSLLASWGEERPEALFAPSRGALCALTHFSPRGARSRFACSQMHVAIYRAWRAQTHLANAPLPAPPPNQPKVNMARTFNFDVVKRRQDKIAATGMN